ncbi:hypothetical protein RTCCBAU85039_3667 [Rhizobium tibeticum]|uniref:Uncharacterized protein n=1 Tax=Rhizobium tibeticum TaxID=501024 RepID=A0A1K0J3Z2_9HYPH|nr:hypothetical protein RTCCBAU85039_3667 [Rhizobium tibeticum]
MFYSVLLPLLSCAQQVSGGDLEGGSTPATMPR